MKGDATLFFFYVMSRQYASEYTTAIDNRSHCVLWQTLSVAIVKNPKKILKTDFKDGTMKLDMN